MFGKIKTASNLTSQYQYSATVEFVSGLFRYGDLVSARFHDPVDMSDIYVESQLSNLLYRRGQGLPCPVYIQIIRYVQGGYSTAP